MMTEVQFLKAARREYYVSLNPAMGHKDLTWPILLDIFLRAPLLQSNLNTHEQFG